MIEAVYNSIVNFLDAYGRIATLIVILFALWRLILWFRGIVPLGVRAGKLRGNTIAIFAKSDHYNELVKCLDTTRLYNKKNFSQIAALSDLESSEGKRIFIVSWEDWGNDIQKILDKKTASTGIVIYALPGAIPHPTMAMLQQYNYVTVTNFRGRLMTDLLTMAVTIRYAKK